MAGYVGYPLCSSILAAGKDFLVRVGGNLDLISEYANIQKLGGGLVLYWPQDRVNSGAPQLRLRLVQVPVGKTMMWMLTSVLDERKLISKHIIEYYNLRWLIEVEFRGLKQTIDKHKLRCRNDARLLAELDWSHQGMAYADLLAMRAQILRAEKSNEKLNSRHRSSAEILRVLRRFMRNLDQITNPDSLMNYLGHAVVQRYKNLTDKRARYRPKNPDIQPLGNPTIRKMTPEEKNKLELQELKLVA